MAAKGRALSIILAIFAIFASSSAFASIPRSTVLDPPAIDFRNVDLTGPIASDADASVDNAELLRHALDSAFIEPPPVQSLSETRVWVSRLERSLFVEPRPLLSDGLQKASAEVWPEIASDPTVLTPDPLGYPDSSNLYAFAGGDPVNGRDPTGELTKTQLGFLIGAFSRGDKGSFGEVALEKLLRRHGRIVLEGPSSGKSVFKGGADIIAVTPDGRIEIWDNKFFTSTDTVSSAPTFTRPDRRAANLDRARQLVLNSNLPNKAALLAKIAVSDVDWLVGAAGPFNRVKRITSALEGRGIQFGSKAYIAKTGRRAGGRLARKLGKTVLATLPIASLLMHAPQLQAAAAEDKFFAELVDGCSDCGPASFDLVHANLIEALSAALGEEVGGGVGCMTGGGLAGLAGLPSGPGAVVTGLAGCIAGSASGEYAGGQVARALVEQVLTVLAADDY
jgi:hypothetical protein